ncbi:hypothetical protein [Mycobacterium avium]|uniref:hypothetical protein n=1 Tax=Mycobacterium avium TaxID=1764 RepID=UPI000CE57B17|nr:hypothetical protein [Mycobacterium avium]
MRFFKRNQPRVRVDAVTAGDSILAKVVLAERVGAERDVRLVFKFGEFGPLVVAVVEPYLEVAVTR